MEIAGLFVLHFESFSHLPFPFFVIQHFVLFANGHVDAPYFCFVRASIN